MTPGSEHITTGVVVDSTILTTFIGVGAIILALSVLVQIVQELYKHVSNSKSRLYVQELQDFLGPPASELAHAPEFADLRTRGSLEFLRRRPGGRLMPLDRQTMLSALEQTTPMWVRRMLSQLQLEKSAGGGLPTTSASWDTFLKRLSSTKRGTTGYWVAREIALFLQENGFTWKKDKDTVGEVKFDESIKQRFEPKVLEILFRQTFLSHIDKAVARIPVLEERLKFSGRRRNLRHTFVIGFLAALIIGFPVQEIYRKAIAASPGVTIELAESVIGLRERISEGTGINTGMLSDSLMVDSVFRPMITTLSQFAQKSGAGRKWPVGLWHPKQWWFDNFGFVAKLLYLLGCLGTAILVSFGAPFWNDILKLALHLRKPPPATRAAGNEKGQA